MAIVLIAVRKRAPPGMIKICPNSLAMFGTVIYKGLYCFRSRIALFMSILRER